MSQLQSLEIGRLRIWLQYIESAYTLHQGIVLITNKIKSMPNNSFQERELKRNYKDGLEKLESVFATTMSKIITAQYPIDDFRAEDPDDWERNFGY